MATTTHWPLFQEQRTDALEKAAPALLEALKAIVALLDGARVVRDSVDVQSFITVLDAAEAAIARAEGKA